MPTYPSVTLPLVAMVIAAAAGPGLARAEPRTGKRTEPRTGKRTDTRTGKRAGKRTEPRTGKRTDTRTGKRAGKRTGKRTDTRTGKRAGKRTGKRTDTRTATDALARMARTLCAARGKGLRRHFEPIFDDASVAKIGGIFGGFNKKFGRCRKAARGSGARVDFVHARATIGCRLYLGAKGKISGIWFDAPRRSDDSVKAVVAELRKLPGTLALTVQPLGHDKRLVAINGAAPLAVGSTFKLFILQALREEIRAGKRRWSDVIKLRRELQSYPSGILQDWPVGSPVTLHTLAGLMISRSDNTATDHLLFTLGRERVERLVPARSRPLLSTMEMFKLKDTRTAKLAARYAGADAARRRALLRELRRVRYDSHESHGKPHLIKEIEWLHSTDELCRVIGSLKEMELLGLNEGVADKEQWRRVGYKGGSEPGVLNMTYALQHRTTGRWICVSSTWIDPADNLKEARLTRLLQRLLHVLATSARW